MFRIIHQGVEIHCDTVDETLEIASRLAGFTAPSGNPKAHVPAGGNGHGGSPHTRWTVSRFHSFMAELQDQQRKMLRSLVSSPDGQTDSALRQHLGLSSNKAFGPILTGISRRAKKAGVSLADVLTTERIIVGNEKVLEFKAAPAFEAVAKEGGGIK